MSAEWQLGIESTAPRGSIVLVRGGEVVAGAEFEAQPNHSAVLSASLAEVLGALPAGARLSGVVVATGPGSYNGARVGIAAGQGVAVVHGCATVGLPSLEAVDEVRQGRAALAVGDARRGTVFAVPLENGQVSGEPKLLSSADWIEEVRGAVREERWIFSLEEIDRLPLPEDLAEAVHFARPQARLAVASWNARSEAVRERLRQTPPQPYYLRPPHITKAKARRPGP